MGASRKEPQKTAKWMHANFFERTRIRLVAVRPIDEVKVCACTSGLRRRPAVRGVARKINVELSVE
jgi:hypothetical protein